MYNKSELFDLFDPIFEYDIKGKMNNPCIFSFQSYHCSAWKWARSIVENCELVSMMSWDAFQLDKFDGKEWVHFLHEPYTASRMWDIQVFITFLLLTGSNLFFVSRQNYQMLRGNHSV